MTRWWGVFVATEETASALFRHVGHASAYRHEHCPNGAVELADGEGKRTEGARD